MRSSVAKTVPLLLALATAAPAGAGTPGAPPAVDLTVASGGNMVGVVLPEPRDNLDGTFTFEGEVSFRQDWGLAFAFTVDDDPFITGTFTLTNLSPQPEDFEVAVTLPVAAPAAPVDMVGSVGPIEFSDADGDGEASFETVGGPGASPIYTALADGNAVQELASLGFSLTLSAPGGMALISQQSFGPEAGAGVGESIGLRLAFRMSGGDRTAIPTLFSVFAGPSGVDASSCPTVPRAGDADGDGVDDACDTCLGLFNPALPDPSAVDPDFPNGWMTLVSGQRDDDADGVGNRCDADFDQSGTVVGGADLALQRSALNLPRDSESACGGPCDVFDLDESGAVIGGADLALARLRFNSMPGPSCAGPDADGDGIGGACDSNPAGAGGGAPGFFGSPDAPILGRAICEGPSC